ncbi:Hypothetical predicted protein [Paramuricea clavata]|uniref:Uncharacterized protein n=1 Tax=Paramuricea clavata TaxID=317549 RepID=A0A6S7H2L0_PARCT|nr:Hypothetical predicted protein [Paramuricea clavata]
MDIVDKIPGSTEKFTVEKYKDELGRPYIANDLVDDPDAETVDPVQVDTFDEYSMQGTPGQANPVQADPEEDYSVQADPEESYSVQADPEETYSVQADPEEADPFQADPFPIESAQIEPVQMQF